MTPAPMPMKQLIPWLRERSEPAGQCWIWSGAVQRSGGSPVARIQGRVQLVRHAIAAARLGPTPEDGRRWWTISTCCDPLCVRPPHIQRVPATEGMAIYCDRGQLVGWAAARIRGRSVSRLTLQQVQQIRAEAEAGMLLREIAARHGISRQYAGRLVRGWEPSFGAGNRVARGSSAFTFRP